MAFEVIQLTKEAVAQALSELGEEFAIAEELAPLPSGQRLQKELTRNDATLPQGFSGLTIDVANVLGQVVTIPVRAELDWTARDDGGAPLQEGNTSSITELPLPPSASFLFAPPLVEQTDSEAVPQPLRRLIVATLILTANPSAVNVPLDPVSKTVELEAPVDVLPLEIPTLLLLARHSDFAPNDPEANLPRNQGGVALLIVPTRSPFRDVEGLLQRLGAGDANAPGLTPVLETLTAALPNIAGLSSFLGRLDFLLSKLDAYVSDPVVLAVRDRERNLNKIEVIEIGGRVRSVEAENEISSLAFIGRPDLVAHLYNKREFKPDRGHLKVKTGLELSLTVGDLHKEVPISTPPNRVQVMEAPATTFGDAFSSFEFADERPPARRRPRRTPTAASAPPTRAGGRR